ncbi:alkaline phosphatase D family protein [Methylobacterium pseudosasicola]|uniref:Phosphodiesterase/alkaline phosphatase D n=1 Tax=Methylobacterium pseudosasicola TaxID=582667 RepID=A0A1I4U1W8_9HYPH|nr:alkaline phosphatase D family protein [Methylobacterium pseudosasicola]SFM82693.1 Phosphodiesterase/alkaline phosphatase D [Methylobacterium pseudosasicola]
MLGLGLRPSNAALKLYGRVSLTLPAGVDPTYWTATKPADAAGNNAAISWAWTGAISQSGVTVTHKLTAAASKARLVVSPNADLSNPIYSLASPSSAVSTVNGTASNIVKQTVQGLAANTTYYHGLLIDGVLDTSKIGKFTTLAATQGSFLFALGGCCRPNVSSAVFSSIIAKNPLFMFALGDTPYGDTISPYTIDSAFDALLTTSSAAQAYRQIPTINMWSDHDFPTGPTSAGGANDANGASSGTTATAASLAFARAYWPNPPGYSAAAADAVGFSYVVGRLRFIVPDCRSQMSAEGDADGTTHTKWGAAQKAWVKQQLNAAKSAGQIVCLFTETPWIQDSGLNGDGWGSFAIERREVMDYIQSVGMAGRAFIVASDMHALAYDDGTHTAGYVTSGSLPVPVFQVGALDQANNASVGTYTAGPVQGVNQFGTVGISDTGGDITVAFNGYAADGSAVAGMSYSFTVTAATLAATTPGSTVPVNKTAPAISGTPTVGQTLTASTGTWSNAPTGYTYQWSRGGSPVSGATGSTYALTSADQGSAMTVAVVASNAAGAGASTTSAATAAVATAAQTLQTLTLSPTTATAGTAYSGTISGRTAGSTVAATSSDGTTLSVSGTTVTGTFSAAGTPTITLTETLSGATNTPKTSTVSITVNAAAGYSFTNSEAQTYVGRMTTTPADARKKLIDDLFTALKSDGTYGLIDWMHLPASANTQAALLDIKGSYDGAIAGSPVFTADRGFSGNGASANHINTTYERTQAVSATKKASVNNESMFVWTNDTNISGLEYVFGAASENIYISRTGASAIKSRMFSGTSQTFTLGTPGAGLIAVTRPSSSAASMYHNNGTAETFAASGSAATGAGPVTANNIVYCGEPYADIPSISQVAVAGMGQALSASNLTTLYNALHVYLQGVGASA